MHISERLPENSIEKFLKLAQIGANYDQHCE